MILSKHNSKFAALLMLAVLMPLIVVSTAGKVTAQVRPGEGIRETGTNKTAAYWITQLSHDHYLRR